MVLQFCPKYYIIFGTKLRGDIMQSSYSGKIKQRIENSPPGTIFINSDFTDIATTETIRRNLNRLTQAGILHHVLNGIYEKPKYSKLLKEYVAVDPNNVAIAMYVNSPGGAVYQADEVYFALKDYKNAGKLFYFYM